MLSETLQCIADQMRPYEASGLTLGQDNTAQLVQLIAAAAEDARDLEQQTDALQSGPADGFNGPTVVRFAPAARK